MTARTHRLTGWLALTCLLASPVHADCAKDRYGEVYCGGGRCVQDGKGTVWCSRFYDGDARRTSDGRVLCGKGRCASDSRGRVFCSAEMGGGVAVDRDGRVRCYGRCEPGVPSYCESTRADAAGG